MMGNRIVRDSCLGCRNLSQVLEFGSCSCDNDYAKSLDASQIGIDEFLRRNGRLREVKKPSYRMVDVELPLKRVLASAQRLAEEGQLLASVTKSLKEREVKRCRKVKIAKSKGRARSSVSNIERSRAQLSWARRQSVKKADNTVVLGCIDGSIKAGQIQGWIEKRLGGA
jgi:hypothetical protein